MDDDYTFLNGISANAGRPGDTSNLNPQFASRVATAVRQAQAQGLNVGLNSAYRNPLELSKQNNPNAGFDAAGNSLHSYGLAVDVNGIGPPGSSTAKIWRSIAAQNGLYNPYNPNGSEWNHWQGVPFTLDQNTGAKAALEKAAATGNFQNVWAAANPYIGGSQPAPTASAYANPPPAAPAAAAINAAAPSTPGTTLNTTTPLAGNHAAFITNYAKQIGLDPNLALGIAQKEGLNAWSASNPNAASYIDRQNGQPFSFGDFQLNIHPGALGAKAIAANIDPRDPTQWQAADKFALDQMKAGGVSPWKGDPVAAAYLKSGAVPSPSIPGVTGAVDPTIAAGGPGATKPGVTPPMTAGDWLTKLTTGADGGQSPLQKTIGDAGKLMDANQQQQQQGPQPQDQLQAQQAAAGLGMQHQQQVAQLAQQTAAALQQRAAKPLSWGSAPPGTTFGAGAGQQQGGAQAFLPEFEQWQRMSQYAPGLELTPPGMTLNSTGGIYG